MWKEGVIGIPKKDGSSKSVRYWVEVQDEASSIGINGGKITQLSLKMNGELVANYDMGWELDPTCEEAEIALCILLYSNN